MKHKILLVWILVGCMTGTTLAQRGIRIAYIDMEYILENVPEYNEATSQLETKVQKWKSEIEIKLAEVEDMKKELNNERVLLTKELIEERDEDIYFKQKEISEYQQARFGPTGDLVVQKKQLVQPVQDQVFNAVQEIAAQKKYDFVFDRSADVVMLYSADRHDISDQILRNISRASKREQIKGKRAKKELVEDEYLSVEAADRQEEKEALLEQKRAEREALITSKKEERDRIRAERQQELETRKAKLLEDRQKIKDSLLQVREEKINALKAKREALKNPATENSGE